MRALSILTILFCLFSCDKIREAEERAKAKELAEQEEEFPEVKVTTQKSVKIAFEDFVGTYSLTRVKRNGGEACENSQLRVIYSSRQLTISDIDFYCDGNSQLFQYESLPSEDRGLIKYQGTPVGAAINGELYFDYILTKDGAVCRKQFRLNLTAEKPYLFVKNDCTGSIILAERYNTELTSE